MRRWLCALLGLLCATPALAGGVPNPVNAPASVAIDNIGYWTGTNPQGNFAGASLTSLLDTIFGNAQGDILYRGASSWTVLAPGTSGYVLETQGASANPQWTSLGALSCPTPGASSLGCVFSITPTSHEWISYLDSTGTFHQSQPAFSDISGSIAASQLIAPTTSAWGAIEAVSCSSGQFISVIPTAQVQPTCAAPSVPSGANPTASLGLSAVNGSSSNFMRADGAPALSQSIAPTWTGQHQFNTPPIVTAGASQTTSTGHVPGTLYSITSTQSTGTGTSEQTLASYSLAANSLDVAGRNLRIVAWFTHAANTHTVSYRLYFGSEVGSQSSSTSGSQNRLELDVLKTGSNTQNVMATAANFNSSSFASGYTAATETDTSAITIKATAQDNTSSAGDCNLVSMTVEYLN